MSAARDTVSVVIPCYNGLPYLPQALESALAQTHRPVEILVVDDGSRDASAQCVRDHMQHHPDLGLRLIEQTNAGEPAARNRGIHAAAGDWVAMLDADDWWEPRKLERQIAAAAQAGPDCVLVHTGVLRHFPDGREEPGDLHGPATRSGWCTEALLEPTGSIGHPSILVRRQALDRIGGYDPEFRQACDIDLYLRLSVVGTFAFVPEPLLHYRVHAGQLSASQTAQIPYHHRAIRKFFREHPDWLARLGDGAAEAALVRHVEVKLESLYWRRRLGEFRQLLEYARANGLASERIAAWGRKARWPDWAILLKERVFG